MNLSTGLQLHAQLMPTVRGVPVSSLRSAPRLPEARPPARGCRALGWRDREEVADVAEHGSGRTGRVTVRDIALEAGVSATLASLALRDLGGVSDSTRARVRGVAQDLGYEPRRSGRAPRQGFRTVGVLVNDVRHLWFIDFLESLMPVLAAQRINVILGDGRIDREFGGSASSTYRALGIDGLIIVGAQRLTAALAEIADRVPTVVTGWPEVHMKHADVIANDDYLGAMIATRHLISLGHKRVAHLSGVLPEVYDAVVRLRRQGYEDAMREASLERYVAVEPSTFSEESGYEAGVRLLMGRKPPTAIFAVSDLLALGAYGAAKELQIPVPDRLSLIGYDNTILARSHAIQLSTVDPSLGELGRQAAYAIAARMDDPSRPAELRLTRPVLQLRRTTGPVAAENPVEP